MPRCLGRSPGKVLWRGRRVVDVSCVGIVMFLFLEYSFLPARNCLARSDKNGVQGCSCSNLRYYFSHLGVAREELGWLLDEVRSYYLTL